MAELGTIHREVDELERIQADLATVASRNDDGRKRDLVEFRRQLAAQIAKVGGVAEPLLTSGGDPALIQAYRAKFSRMRSAAAMHQARWPAVLLGENPEEYRASALSVREANKEFVAWMRDALNALTR